MHVSRKSHNVAVQEGKTKYGDEPEMAEYLARWTAFVTEMNALGDHAESTFGYITDHELDMADANEALLINEWPTVVDRITLRKNRGDIKKLERAVELQKDPVQGEA